MYMVVFLLFSFFQLKGPLDHSHFDMFPPELEEPPDEFSGWDKDFWKQAVSMSLFCRASPCSQLIIFRPLHWPVCLLQVNKSSKKILHKVMVDSAWRSLSITSMCFLEHCATYWLVQMDRNRVKSHFAKWKVIAVISHYIDKSLMP